MSGKDQVTKRAPGRPRKHASEAKNTTLTFRVRRGLYGQLLDTATRNDQSISEAIEERLTKSFSMSELYGDQDTQNLAVMICHAGRAAQARTGKPWHQDDFTRRSMSRALRVLAALIEPRGDREPGALTEEQESLAVSEGRVIAEAAWTVSNPLIGPDPGLAAIVDDIYARVADEIEGRT